ncbi:MAG TPA: hypothetical protein VFP50_14450 [Anaeromyxobacteraceae bacterium]|nr:hypothetical protein [Anaeromyxobacteraceae bacterium]
MPKHQPTDPLGDEELPSADAYAVPADLDEPGSPKGSFPEADVVDVSFDDDAGPPRKKPSGLKVGIALAVLALAGGSLLAYRYVHRSRVLAAGMAKAEALIRQDTAAGYREAATLLEPLAEMDPLDAGSLRAFALAMLAADYRDPPAEQKAEALLVEPGRAEKVPVYANLASAALFLGRRAVGDATTYAGRARTSPWGGALQGRLALVAGNPEAGVDPATAAAALDPKLAAAQAVAGDLLRRARQDAAGARAAYQAALAVSPTHPRAALGLAKLALGSQIPLAEAIGPLQKLVGDTQATPRNERARAALLLAAIELRSGDRPAATAALEGIEGLDAAGRGWAERAARVMAEERKRYRAVLAAPAPLQSASDDDPPEVLAVEPEPPPPPPPPAPVLAPKKAMKHAAAPAAKKAAAAKKPAAKKPAPKTAAKKPVR